MSLTNSVLVLSSGATEYSVRAATQRLGLDQASQKMRRTVNARMVDISDTQFRKYLSTITCTDVESPAFDALWPGMTITVDCIVELSYVTLGGSASRDVVPGSSRVSGDLTFYRPRLTMMVVNREVEEDEWNKAVSWTLDLAEV